MGKELNARPARSLNQRPSAASKSIPQSKYPAANTQRPPLPYSAQKISASMSQKQPQKPVQQKPVQQPQQTANTSSTPKQSSTAVSSFVGVMRSMVSSFAILSDEVIQKNLDLASGKGMSNDDRTVSFECADYLMSNLAFIFMGLVLDKDFKDAFVQSVIVEMNLDKSSDDDKAKVRKSMKDTHEYESMGSIVIGVTTFVSSISTDLMNKMQDSFDKLDSFADEFESEVAKLTEDQKVEYGFIFSNFMYLIRAFTHNDMFLSYVITVIEKVKETIKNTK